MRAQLEKLLYRPKPPLLKTPNPSPIYSKFKHPMRMLICGKSQTGKTTLAVKIIKHMASQVERIIIISPTFDLQPTWDPVRELIKEDDVYTKTGIVFKALRYQLEAQKYRKTLLVLDDVSSERDLNQGAKGHFNWLVYNAVWINLSIICIAHSLSSVSTGLRQNLEHLMMFLTTRPKEIDKLAEEFNVTGDKKSMKELYKTAVLKPLQAGDPHSFLYIYLGSPPEFYRKFEAKLSIGVVQAPIENVRSMAVGDIKQLPPGGNGHVQLDRPVSV